MVPKAAGRGRAEESELLSHRTSEADEGECRPGRCERSVEGKRMTLQKSLLYV